MAWRGEVEDGSGWGGLVASKSEQREEVRLAALERDAARYRHLFDCPEPFCYRGEVYDTKAEADAVIDSAMRE